MGLEELATPKIVPPLDPAFRPAALVNRAFLEMATEPCVIGIQRPDGNDSRFETSILPEGHRLARLNAKFIERTVKFLLWQRGGHRVLVSGPRHIADHLTTAYGASGERSFDADLIGRQVFERDFEVVHCGADEVPPSRTSSLRVGRNLDGCRVGFDLGASDRKTAAVIDGKEVFSEETVWDPRGNSDPEYHYREIKAGIERARAHMPRIDAIGGSSAGVIVDNRVMVASIFRSVAPKDFPKARDVYLRLQAEYKVPFQVANDGDVTALAGAMSLEEGRVLGIAMGSSEAAGYVDADGNITGWLNELAFAPIDYAPSAPQDEWSGDIGCGVQYLTQQAVFRLAEKAGIDLSKTDVAAEKLRIAQDALESGHPGAKEVWQSIGVAFGYAIAHYACFYDIGRVLTLGRVTSGGGGPIIIKQAELVLKIEFPELADVRLSLPDEKTRRVGQAVAAASLPSL